MLSKLYNIYILKVLLPSETPLTVKRMETQTNGFRINNKLGVLFFFSVRNITDLFLSQDLCTIVHTVIY